MKPFRFFGIDTLPPDKGFYDIRNFLRDEPIIPGQNEITIEFSATEMKQMFRPSLELVVFDADGDIKIESVGILGKKMIVRLERRTVTKAHIKYSWIVRFLYNA
jgi:hypothetical protein